MAPKSSKNSSKSSKERDVFAEPVISSEEEDPEEDEEEETNPTTLNGFVSDSGSDYDSDNSGYKVEPVPKAVQVVPSPKRPSASTNANPSKKPKTTNTNTISTMSITPSSNSKKQSGGNGNSVSRIWLKDDEIVMLTELYDFKKSKGGVDVHLDMAAFYDSVKGKLSGEYTKDQLKSKIRHMKAKYMGIVKKIEKGSGESVGFASSHEALVFDLSKKAWGHVVKDVDNNVVVETVVNDNVNRVVDGKKKNRVNAVVENVVMVDENGEKEKEGVEERFVDVSSYKFLNESIGVSKYQEFLGLSDAAFKLMNENLHLIGKENASDLDGDWKELFMEEVELNHKRASLLKKQAELVFDCIKKP